MEPIKCRHGGCSEMHKNLTGYCYRHAESHDRARVRMPRSERACSQPMLAEEHTGGYMMPKVI